MKTTMVLCDKCGHNIEPGSNAAAGAREVAVNVMTDEWTVEGGQETLGDLCAPCVARLRGWIKEKPEALKPKRRSRR